MRHSKAGIYWLSVLWCISCGAQEVTFASKSVSIKISGTSTLHNWEMLSAQGECKAGIIPGIAGKPDHLSQLYFNTPVTALHSGHATMDKNALAALRSERFPTISWSMGEAEIGADGAVLGKGTLTIAGVSRQEEMSGVFREKAADGFTMVGTKKIHLRDFSVVPPSVLLGAIKSGEDIVLEFTIVMARR